MLELVSKLNVIGSVQDAVTMLCTPYMESVITSAMTILMRELKSKEWFLLEDCQMD